MSVTTFGTLSLEDTFAAGEGDRRRARIRRFSPGSADGLACAR